MHRHYNTVFSLSLVVDPLYNAHEQEKLVKTVVANYILWPVAHFINFRFVPSQHRILYNNLVAVSLAVHVLQCSCWWDDWTTLSVGRMTGLDGMRN